MSCIWPFRVKRLDTSEAWLEKNERVGPGIECTAFVARGGKQQPGTWGGAILYPQKYGRGRDTDDLGVFLQKDNTLVQLSQTVANAL